MVDKEEDRIAKIQEMKANAHNRIRELLSDFLFEPATQSTVKQIRDRIKLIEVNGNQVRVDDLNVELGFPVDTPPEVVVSGSLYDETMGEGLGHIGFIIGGDPEDENVL